MLNHLSDKYSKEIALSFLSLFFVSGLGTLKAESIHNNPSGNIGKLGINFRSAKFRHYQPPPTTLASGNSSFVFDEKSFNDRIMDSSNLKDLSPAESNEGKGIKKLDIGGPSQPEMAAFKPVGADNMVDPFTGDFSYNIPLLDVGGYPVNMFYNSGITMDQEASWLGLGWNINPGTIMRNMRGLPDDFNGTDLVIKRQSIRPDKTWGVSAGAGLKFGGFPTIGLDVNTGLSFNNKLGVATEAAIHPSLSISKQAGGDKTAALSFGANLSASSRDGAALTPSVGLSIQDQLNETDSRTGSIGVSYTQTSRTGITGLHLDASLTRSKSIGQKDASKYYPAGTYSGTDAALGSSISFAYPTIVPSIKSVLTRRSYNLSFSVGGEIFGLNGHGRLAGYFTESKIADEDIESNHPAYGMLHYQDANNNPKALLDFNRANDGVYTPKSPAIAMPVYTYDVFSINGEGVGGSFRATRNDLGYMRDTKVKTKDDAASLGLDLGFGNTVHGGAEFSYAYTPSEVGGWDIGNLAKNVFQFQQSSGAYQSVYFRNPGEKTIPNAAFQTAIGDESLVRLKLSGGKSPTPMLLPKLMKYDANKNLIGEQELSPSSVIQTARNKRTQVISFLTADEAARVGFDKKIYSYDADTTKVIFGAACNKTGIDSFERYEDDRQPWARKRHHISEIDVLGTDGRKYVYGVPVYNTKQLDVSFSVNKDDNNVGTTTYTPGTDDTKDNKKGRDWYMNQEVMPAYTHSFLLSALVSPNYVDVTGDGITEDDMGDAVKFNYSKLKQGYKWRTPVEGSKAAYSEGLKTDEKDDKAHYTYGEREMWYLYTIESKNMVARFYIKNDRKDCRQALDSTGALDDNWGMQRLYKISLFSKSDLMKGVTNKPIKTIRFFQSYKLCRNHNGAGNSLIDNGKLTLDSVWISYNGNEKKAKSRYVFYYPSDAAKNPDYSFTSNDRWGNYKPSDASENENPGALSNTDYPYVVNNKVKADTYASAWVMNKVLLPSGGVINLDFESDDYAYVQNKPAANMFRILGFGTSPTPSVSERTNPNLYAFGGGTENDHLYVQLTSPILSTDINQQKRELEALYLENTEQIYFKLAVQMLPNVPAGLEMIPVYADIDTYGIVPGTGGLVAYIKVKPGDGGNTPMVQQTLQFIKQQLPGQAYPGYDVSDQSGAKGVVIALAGMITSVKSLAMGENTVLKKSNKCRTVETAKSFVRLSNPSLVKYGGGLRVKKVTINDNWNKMTSQYESTYGQEYKYTSTELVNGKLTTISSGVASWEPGLGGDENPHKEIMRYVNHNKGGPFDFGAVEMPLGEMFYPSPLIGYSRVEVLSIHRDTVKNLPTRQVTEFYTTREFPFRSSATQLGDPEANVPFAPSALKQLLKLDMQKAVTQSQGFLIDMNDMNGKIKVQATYSAKDAINPISSTQNFYNVEKATDKTYRFNHTFPTISQPSDTIKNALIGRDIELMADFREHTTETITTNISVNFDFFFLGMFPIPWTNLLQPVVHEGMTYRSASLLKIVNHYGMIDSTVVIDRGSMVSTKNLVYDAQTGNAILTRTNNEHNKPVYNFSYPAYWAYSGMGPASQNIDIVLPNLRFRNGLLETQVDMSIFESGDEMYVLTKSFFGPVAAYPCDQPGFLPTNFEKKIWVVNTAKVGSAHPQLIFMDKNGNPYTAERATIKIIRSGHRNMLDQVAGTITSLKRPINPTANKLEFVDATNIIQTSAASFKDNWRVDNSFYLKDSLVKSDWVSWPRKIDIDLSASVFVERQRKPSGNTAFFKYFSNPSYVMARRWDWGHNHSDYAGYSWMKFNLTTLENGLDIFDARLNLNGHYRNGKINKANIVHPELHNDLFPHSNAGGELANFVNISRVTVDGATTEQGWKNLFQEGGRYDDATSNALIPPTQQGESNASYNNIDVLKIVKQIYIDKNKPNQSNANWLRMSIQNSGFNRKKAEARQCFYGTGSYAHPFIRIYYNDCYNLTRDPQAYDDEILNRSTTCSDIQNLSFCVSKFSRKAINPYVEGVLGNWRVDSSFVYYGDRKEVDPGTAADTRIAGTIINFKKFWNFTATGLVRNFDAANVWTWNSTITQYNRKGYEIENKDPLNRYNSGLYGYNQQLPIAVANNARVREVMFDGFEDYSYQTASNCISCKPHRHANFGDLENHIIDTQHHTGLYSLLVAGNDSVTLKAPVTDFVEANKSYGLRVKIDSTSYLDTAVEFKGNGFKGKYYNYGSQNNCDNAGAEATAILNSTTNPWERQREQINFAQFQLPGDLKYDRFAVRWEGYIQPIVSGIYSFRLSADDGFDFKLWDKAGSTSLASTRRWDCGWGTDKTATTSQPLLKGELYKVTVDYYEFKGNQSFQLLWQTPGSTRLSEIPKEQTYSIDSLSKATGTVTVTGGWCQRLDSVQVRGNALTDTFSLIQSKKMLLSAWVKEGGNDCKCSTYVNNNIVVSYTGNSQVETMKPTGSIIEGWQRYESVFTVPANATQITIGLKNLNSSGGPGVYFDDIRIHPFNANVKSFVYHDSNLRLMSELDENNYGSFYEYDDDGTLTRVKKETVNGIKTITETRSAMQKSIQ